MFAKSDSKLSRITKQWVVKSNVPMGLLGLVYLLVYSAQVLNSRNQVLVDQLEIVSIVIWSMFFVDLIFRFVGSDSLAKFLTSSALEIIALIAPFIRVLRVFRVVLAINGIIGFAKNRASATATYILMLVPLAWFSGAIAVLDAESHSVNSSITNLREALWWSLTTITTGGYYGDQYPITFEGQLVAGALMCTGIALLGAAAGIFANWIMSGDQSPANPRDENSNNSSNL